jgi:hypothetical protein
LSQASEVLRVPISQVMNWQQQAQAQVGVSTGGVGGALLSIGLPTPQVPLQTLKPSVVQPIVNPVIPPVGVATQSGSNGVQSTVRPNSTASQSPTHPVVASSTAMGVSAQSGARVVQQTPSPALSSNPTPLASSGNPVVPISMGDSTPVSNRVVQPTTQSNPVTAPNPVKPLSSSVTASAQPGSSVQPTPSSAPKSQPMAVPKSANTAVMTGSSTTSTTPTVQANPAPTARPTSPVSSPVTASPSAGSRGVQPVTQPNIPPRQSATQSISPTSGSDSPQQVASQPKPTSVANPNNPSVRAVRTSDPVGSGVVPATSQARPRPQPNPVQKPVNPVSSSDSPGVSNPTMIAGVHLSAEGSPQPGSRARQDPQKSNPLSSQSTPNPKEDEG